MCGNGGRCIVAFAQKLGIIQKEETTFSAPDGLHKALFKNNLIHLQMQDVSDILKAPCFASSCVIDATWRVKCFYICFNHLCSSWILIVSADYNRKSRICIYSKFFIFDSNGESN